MHRNVNQELIKWYLNNKQILDHNKVADLGAFDINGSVKDVIKHVIGFDIYDGKNVDVVIKPGIIPDEHRGCYAAVTSVSSFQFCPDSNLYKKQILDLLSPNGLLFLTMCGSKCTAKHSTSPNDYGFGDSVRYSIEDLIGIFTPELDIIEVYEMDRDHNDIILKAKKK